MFPSWIGFLACDKLGWIFNPWPPWKYVNLPAAIVSPILSPPSLPPASCPCVFLLGYAVLKKVKDSRCGTPLLLYQLPHQCIILPNLTSLPTQSFSLPAALTPSPPPTPFFLFYFSSLPFIPCSPVRLRGLTNYSSSRQIQPTATPTGSLHACRRHAADWYDTGCSPIASPPPEGGW